MFKNRAVEMRVVKDKEPKSTDGIHITPNDFTPLVVETVQNVTAGTAVVLVAYVSADTLRRIIMHVVATKIN